MHHHRHLSPCIHQRIDLYDYAAEDQRFELEWDRFQRNISAQNLYDFSREERTYAIKNSQGNRESSVSFLPKKRSWHLLLNAVTGLAQVWKLLLLMALIVSLAFLFSILSLCSLSLKLLLAFACCDIL
jgi:hypothetical protein